jgi:hypothetical protein
MLVLPDYCFPYIIDNVNGPVVPKYCWFYDAELNDFLLRPILLLEETRGWTVKLSINGLTFMVPASWNLLVVDVETKIIDTVQVAKCNSNSYQAFLMSPEEGNYRMAPIVLLDLFKDEACVHVMIPRMHMLVHPVGTILNNRQVEKVFSCLLSPQDIGKNMYDMTAMELLV